MIFPFLCLLFTLSASGNKGGRQYDKAFRTLEEKIDVILQRNENDTFLGSCLFGSSFWSSNLYYFVRENSMSGCYRRCCEAGCNYWSYYGTGARTYCYLYSQVTHDYPFHQLGYTSGVKGCPKPAPMSIDSCLLTNLQGTSDPITPVFRVNNYVDCGKHCTDNDGCTFWSFTRSGFYSSPGDCYLFSNGSEVSKYNSRYISGPSGCPSSNGTCPA